jgi:aspartate aminotransferase
MDTAAAARPSVDVRARFPAADTLPETELRDLSGMALGLVGSEILKIAAEIRALQATGATACNLTVGDFAPAEFPIPRSLQDGVAEALAAGHTNYPPSDGVMELRQAVKRYYERELGLSYPVESILIAAGARPVIYATYRAVLNPREKVLYTTPSWNNNHYTHLADAQAVELVTGPDTNFLPTAETIAPHLEGVRLLAINTPLNPTGTVMSVRQVTDIAQLVVDENRRRAARGDRSLFVMWDQVYWMLTFGEAKHWCPPQLVPESAAHTVFVDGISKCFAATGLRVGWAVAPPHVTARMRDILGHVGAWAPRAEQVATARLLDDVEAIRAFHAVMIADVCRRLDLLHHGFQSMRRDGLPVDSVAPQGAIYLSARFDLVGRRTRDHRIESNEDVRRLLLHEAGFAVVPFQAFGLREDSGWMRLSVGAVSPDSIEAGLGRVRALLERFRGL